MVDFIVFLIIMFGIPKLVSGDLPGTISLFDLQVFLYFWWMFIVRFVRWMFTPTIDKPDYQVRRLSRTLTKLEIRVEQNYLTVLGLIEGVQDNVSGIIRVMRK